MTFPTHLAACLAGQIDRVGRRAPYERTKIQQAVDAVPELVSHLGLGAFVDLLVSDDKPRLLLHFRHTSVASLNHLDGDLVLKIYGDRPRGEGPLLGEWAKRGVPVPRLESGETELCSWLLMEYLEPFPAALHSIADWLKLTDTLASMADTMHLPAPHLNPVLRQLEVVMLPRWVSSRLALEQQGRDLPHSWQTLAASLYGSSQRRPLHGDLAMANIGATKQGTPVLFDASALLGPAVFDAARWAARLTVLSMSALDVFARWLLIESCDDGHAYELLALECVLEAGTLDSRHHGHSSATPDVNDAVHDLLRVAHLILG